MQSIEDKVLLNAVEVLKQLPGQPDIFPTFRDSVQFEYEEPDGEYLEFEVFEDKIGVFSITSNGKEKEFQIIVGNIKERTTNERI